VLFYFLYGECFLFIFAPGVFACFFGFFFFLSIPYDGLGFGQLLTVRVFPCPLGVSVCSSTFYAGGLFFSLRFSSSCGGRLKTAPA